MTDAVTITYKSNTLSSTGNMMTDKPRLMVLPTSKLWHCDYVWILQAYTFISLLLRRIQVVEHKLKTFVIDLCITIIDKGKDIKCVCVYCSTFEINNQQDSSLSTLTDSIYNTFLKPFHVNLPMILMSMNTKLKYLGRHAEITDNLNKMTDHIVHNW